MLAYFIQLFLTSYRLLFSSVISPLFSRAFSLQLLFGSLSSSFSLTSLFCLSFILGSTSPLFCYCIALNFSSLLGSLLPFFLFSRFFPRVRLLEENLKSFLKPREQLDMTVVGYVISRLKTRVAHTLSRQNLRAAHTLSPAEKYLLLLSRQIVQSFCGWTCH